MCICSLYNLKAFAYFFMPCLLLTLFWDDSWFNATDRAHKSTALICKDTSKKKTRPKHDNMLTRTQSLLVTTTWGEIQNIPTSSKPPGRHHTLNNARPRHLWRNLGFYDGVLVQQSATLSVSFVCNSRSRWSSGLSSSVSVEMTNWVFTPFGWYSFL